MIDGATQGHYVSQEHVAGALEKYRQETPGDSTFAKVTVWEMPEAGTVGHEVSVYDFVPQ